LPRVIHEYKKMTKKDWLVMLTITVFASVLGTIFYTAALGKVNYINYSVVVLLQQTQPIFAIALAGLLLKEALTKKYLIQAVIGLAAAYFLAFPSLRPNVLGLSGETSAAMLAMGAAIAWGSATVLGKLILKTLSFVCCDHQSVVEPVRHRPKFRHGGVFDLLQGSIRHAGKSVNLG